VRGTWAFVLVSSACGFSPHATEDGAIVVGDSRKDADMVVADALPDSPPGEICFGTLAYDRICYLAANVPSGTKTYQTVQGIDTDDGPTCNGNTNLASTIPGNPCIVAAASIALSLNADLGVFGSRPLILLATGPSGITIGAGTDIDAGANSTSGGPGSPDHCNGTTAATQKSGAFGGSFLALGGKGGLGDGNPAGSKGLPAPVLAMPAMLQGGCPGGIGGNSDATSPADGGGAIALVAMTLTIDGIVAAGGAGGTTPEQDQAGGNGGGAGGMIVLDALAITGTGELNAKGGGGAEGKGGNVSSSGRPGFYPTNRTEDGLGGSTVMSSGGDGGHGGPFLDATAAITNVGEDGKPGTTAGGGGGGGAAGLVLTKSALPIMLVSNPAAVVAP